MNINYKTDLAYAKLIAERSDLTLSISSDVSVPHTDGKTVFLPPLLATWDVESKEYIQWWYALVHECYHNRHQDDFELLKKLKLPQGSFLGTVMNIAVDYKIEYLERGTFRGRDSLVAKARHQFANEHIYDIMARTPAADDNTAILHAVWVMDAIARSSYIPEIRSDKLADCLSTAAADKLCVLLEEDGLFEQYVNQQTADDTYQVSKRILELFGIPEDTAPDEGQDSSGGDEGGDSETQDWREFAKVVCDDHDPKCRIKEPVGGTDYDKGGSGWVAPDHVEHDMREYRPMPMYASRIQEIVDGSSLSKLIRKELQYLSKTRRKTNQKSGRIHPKSLVKFKTAHDPKVFQRKTKKISTKDTVVSLLVDASGSMSGPKFTTASASAVLLSGVLTALKVDHCITGFSALVNLMKPSVDTFLIKAFGESVREDQLVDRFSACVSYLCENADGESILIQSSELMKQKQARKIMIVLSDGAPSAPDAKDSHRGCDTYTRDVIQQIERDGLIEIYAIGIADRSVSEFYSNYDVINDASELESKLLNVLKNKFIGSL